ncbi:spore coat polysaccharide biosynthesis protein SpsF (cytidylyltransferase family) [Azospirillum fermentarium]|uniref:glycosyltransferase family protein n=1 Tax=Azospirillum fermentarium TaxID=1233114 RepID=UPI002225F0CC|nr:glycosyltransferase family protein [Azospirillum fermentarium]MCW2249519.1 spore coat polysaccharide biosynthesis protein SpsF (cytidylyltransferase family) [Azospirillum fermentarium]
MTTAIIVQARMTSTRLPGKVLLPLGDRTALAQVLGRCRLVRGVDVVCCAVPDAPASDPVAAEAEACGAVVVRGSEHDVLGRYRQAAEVVAADLVMRVTSDCPLIDPESCAAVIAEVAAGRADYACNNMPRTWPHGLDCEAFPAALLERAGREATAPYEREHVTPWMRTHPGLRRVNVPGPRPEQAGLRWTLDFPEDYVFLKAVFGHLPPLPEVPSATAVAAMVAADPGLSAAAERCLETARRHA